MTHTEVNYPIYIYVKKVNGQHYEGDFCKGRKPTEKEYKIFEKYKMPHIESFHFIEGLRNPLHGDEVIIKKSNYKSSYAFPSLESLIDEAIITYTKNNFTSGLILGFDGKNPLPDRVLVIGAGNYKTEIEFLEHAQKNNMWTKMLNQ